MALDPEQREAIIKALNDDTNKLLAELDPNDPLALRLRDELRLTNEHFYKLLQAAQRGPEPELSDKFDEKIMLLLQRLEEAWRNLNDRVSLPLPRDIDVWEKQILEHKVSVFRSFGGFLRHDSSAFRYLKTHCKLWTVTYRWFRNSSDN